MNRIETACYALIGSAFVLAGMLVYSLGAYQNQAHAELLIARDNFYVMTARTSGSEESLFVLDNGSGRLYVYVADVARNRIELAGGEDLRRLFSQGGGAGGR